MIFFVIIPCILCFLYAWRRRRRILQGNLPPICGLSWPIIGLSHLWMTGLLLGKLIDIQMDCLKQGSMTLLYAGINSNYTYYAICDPDDVQKVMDSCLEKAFLLTESVETVFGKGLATASVSVWEKRRIRMERAIQHLLTSDFLNEQARLLVEELTVKEGKGFFDSSRYVLYAVMRILFSTIVNQNQNEQEFGKNVDLCVKSVENIYSVLYIRHSNIFLHNKVIFNCTKSKSKLNEAIRILNEVINDNIKRKMAEKENKAQSITDAARNSNEDKALLDHLLELQAENIYTEDDVIKEIITIIFNGYFSLSNTLINILYLLGSHEWVQKKVYDEIMFLSQNYNIIKIEDLSNFLYLDAVIMETLRLYPPITILPRLVDKKIVLSKYTIKSNSNCMVCVYAMNRHPKWGVDVECFNPERWLSDAAPSAFASFGVGKRNCIGKLFSLTAMKILLINLMKEYAISTNGVKMAVKQKLFLSSYSGHHVSLQKRR